MKASSPNSISTESPRLAVAADGANRHRFGLLLMTVLVLGAGVLRLDGIATRTIGHNEIYVPGIPLPDDISIPEPRHTFVKTITTTIVAESHPPGYYLLMLAWTKVLGTNLFSIRLPSVLLGCGTAVLLAVLGTSVGFRRAGLLAALLWATGGLAIHQEQEARPYPLACFLGVLSSLFLIHSYRARRANWMLAGYVLATLAGLATEMFFWPILFAQFVFALARRTGDSPGVSRQVHWQLAIVAAASPLIAIAAFQSGRASYLVIDWWHDLQGYFGLLYAWSRGVSGVWAGDPGWVAIVPALAGGLLVVLALRALRSMPSPANGSGNIVQCPRWLGGAVAVVAVVLIEVLAFETSRREFSWLEDRTALIVACGLVPILAVLASWALRRPGNAPPLRAYGIGAGAGDARLIALLALLPVTLVALVSLAIPVFARRTVYPYGPYLLLLVAIGATATFRGRVRRTLVIAVLLLLNGVGTRPYVSVPRSPTDYATLATIARANSEPGDLWFVFRHWVTTPIFYYLRPPEYRIVGSGWETALAENPNARVWVLAFDGLDPPQRVTEPLRTRRLLRRIEARGIHADLYDRADIAGRIGDP